MAARGDVALVYDLPGANGAAKAPVVDALRMLAVFSLPTAMSAVALRRERYELSGWCVGSPLGVGGGWSCGSPSTG